MKCKLMQSIQSENHYKGDLRGLVHLFFPILMMTFSTYLFFLVEKVLLARFSISAMEAALTANYTAQLMLAPCVALAMMAQVYVARWRGANELTAIGPGIWQFIWFSFLSMVFTVPLGLFVGQQYFAGTDIEKIVMPYYDFFVYTNFLYPLGTALSCFYLAQGKTRLVVFSTIASQGVKLSLSYLLIFGWEDIIPSWGILGGALSTLIAQGTFCLGLFLVFINKENAKIFNTRNWRFRGKLFIDCIYPGSLRACNRILNAANWTAIAYLMTSKGGDYLLFFSIGGTVSGFLPFLSDAVCQAQTTIVSQILGSGKYHFLKQAFKSGMALSVIAIVLFGIPLLIFPSFTFEYLFPSIVLGEESIHKVFWGVWLCFACFSVGFIPISYILAFKDTKFSLFMGFLNWVNGFLFMYFFIEWVKISPSQFWIILCVMHGSTSLLYYLRMLWLEKKLLAPTLQAV